MGAYSIGGPLAQLQAYEQRATFATTHVVAEVHLEHIGKRLRNSCFVMACSFSYGAQRAVRLQMAAFCMQGYPYHLCNLHACCGAGNSSTELPS